jgi:hypothetical protein
MKMLAAKRALDKLYKRRDRYEIPDLGGGPGAIVRDEQSPARGFNTFFTILEPTLWYNQDNGRHTNLESPLSGEITR